MAGEKTEKASPQKRKKASESGDLLISRELNSSAGMLAATVALGLAGTLWATEWKSTYHACMALISQTSVPIEDAGEIAFACRSLLIHASLPMGIFAFSAIAGTISMGLVQGAGRITISAVSPKWSRMNPAANLKHLFGLQALFRLAKSLLPTGFLVWIAVKKLCHLQFSPPHSMAQSTFLFTNIYDLLLDTAIVMFVWSGIDYLNSWKVREVRLRMTKQDVRDEMKEADGSPQVKQRIRRLQRQGRKRKLRADVKHATVVLTNPTHYAVALSFDFVKMEPPKVLAKGRDLVAQQIREEASWAGVPIIENPPLARSLYRSVEAGQTIPFELYAAVAAILAYLYRQEIEQRNGQQNAAKKPAAGGSSTEYGPRSMQNKIAYPASHDNAKQDEGRLVL